MSCENQKKVAEALGIVDALTSGGVFMVEKNVINEKLVRVQQLLDDALYGDAYKKKREKNDEK